MTIDLTEAQKIKILNSDDVYSVMQELLLREQKIDQDKEHFWMLGLAQNSRIMYIELVSLGSVKATTVEPMNVFRWAVMKGVVKVIMCHNHPSGELTPSVADKDLTDRLIQVGRIINIKVLDHLIISTSSFLSFADTGIMAELQESLTWVPTYEVIRIIRQEEKKIREKAVKVAEKKGVKQGEKKKAVEIARGLKKDGIPIEIIAKNTGLTKKVIEKLDE